MFKEIFSFKINSNIEFTLSTYKNMYYIQQDKKIIFCTYFKSMALREFKLIFNDQIKNINNG